MPRPIHKYGSAWNSNSERRVRIRNYSGTLLTEHILNVFC